MPTENRVLVRELGDSPRAAFSETSSVGLGGCGFRSDLELVPGTEIEVRILVEPRLLQAKATVAYCRPLDAGGFDVGVQFVELDTSDRTLLEWLLEAWSSGGPG